VAQTRVSQEKTSAVKQKLTECICVGIGLYHMLYYTAIGLSTATLFALLINFTLITLHAGLHVFIYLPLSDKGYFNAGFMTHVTCRLTAKNRDQLRNPTLGNRVWV